MNRVDQTLDGRVALLKRAVSNRPDGKAIHAELTLRGTTLMLGPQTQRMGSQNAKSLGDSPMMLYFA